MVCGHLYFLLPRPLAPDNVGQGIARCFADNLALGRSDGKRLVVQLLDFRSDHHIQLCLSFDATGVVLSDASVGTLVLPLQVVCGQMTRVLVQNPPGK